MLVISDGENIRFESLVGNLRLNKIVCSRFQGLMINFENEERAYRVSNPYSPNPIDACDGSIP